MRQFSRIVARNSAFGMGAQIAIKLLSFCFTVLIIRNLGDDVYGQYTTIVAYGAIFIFFADLGLSPYAVREIARWRDAPDGIERVNTLFGNLLALRFCLSIVAGLMIVVSAWLTGQPLIIIGAILLNAFGLVIYSVHGASEAVLAGFERLDINAGARVVYQLLFVVGGGVALWYSMGYYGLIAATLIAITWMTYICWRGVQRLGLRPKRPTFHTWPALIRISIPFGIIGFTLGLSYKFDTLLLQHFFDYDTAGHYNAAYTLVFSSFMLSNIINTALYPSLARQSATASETLPMIYERAIRYLLMIGLPIAVGGWALSGQIIPFLYETEFMPAIPVLQIIIWTVPLMFMTEFLGYAVVISGQERRVARAVIISTTCNILINILVIPRFGIIGAAVTTVFTELVLVTQYVWMLRGMLRQLNWGHALIRPLLATLLMGMAVIALSQLPLLLNIAMGVLVYAILLIVLGVVGKEELHFVQSLRQRQEATS
ncbi:MAG: flippase [Chloroflexota bacterium]